MKPPDYYDPSQIGVLYPPATQSAASAGRAAGLPPAISDRPQRALLLIDAQVDFIHSDGALSVPGALEDTRRTIEWVYEHAGSISAIAASLDSHYPVQIFYPEWWVNQDGVNPAPYTVITLESLEAGRWKPTRDESWSLSYLKKLEAGSKKELMIWPYHTMVGTPGHAIVPPLYEAMAFHAAARQSPSQMVSKGSIPESEFYSMLEPEVPLPGWPGGGLNRDLLGWLKRQDQVYVAGQAKSHCVLETIGSLVKWSQEYPGLLEKTYLLEDCTSSVVHPEIDFEAMAEVRLAEFESAGLKRISSTDPLG